MNIALTPKYTPLVQKPFCCNVTCLQMILYRRGHGLFDQEQMAHFFGIKVSPAARESFNVKLGAYTRTNFDEGLKTIDSAPAINKFFRKNKLPLRAEAFRASQVENLKEFVVDNLRQDNDLWLEYKSHRIHGKKLIHDSVIESITSTPQKEWITLVDPQGSHKTRIPVPLGKILEAISSKFGRETGFIVISKNLRRP